MDADLGVALLPELLEWEDWIFVLVAPYLLDAMHAETQGSVSGSGLVKIRLGGHNEVTSPTPPGYQMIAQEDAGNSVTSEFR